MLFTRFFDIEFSKWVIVFDPNRKQPTVPYVHSPDPDMKPVIHVNIGAGSVNMILGSGADINEISARNYPATHVPLTESLGKRKQAMMIGYLVPSLLTNGHYSFKHSLSLACRSNSQLHSRKALLK